jgi:hypothetical protein
MRSNLPTSQSLSVCTAANFLGIDKYVTHLYKKCDSYFHNVEFPTYEKLDAIITFMNDYPRFCHLVTQKTAKLLREDMIEDLNDFNNYQHQHPALAHAITKANIQHQNRIHAGEMCVYREEEAQKNAEWDEARKAHRDAHIAAKAARDAAHRAKRKTEDATDEESIIAKLAGPIAKRKFTPRERSYWNPTRGIRPPKGA